MMVEPNRIPRMGWRATNSQAHPTELRADRAHSSWLRANLALLAATLWLLLANAVTAAGGGGLVAILLGAAAVLWIGIAWVETLAANAISTSQRSNRPIRRQAIPYRS